MTLQKLPIESTVFSNLYAIVPLTSWCEWYGKNRSVLTDFWSLTAFHSIVRLVTIDDTLSWSNITSSCCSVVKLINYNKDYISYTIYDFLVSVIDQIHIPTLTKIKIVKLDFTSTVLFLIDSSKQKPNRECRIIDISTSCLVIKSDYYGSILFTVKKRRLKIFCQKLKDLPSKVRNQPSLEFVHRKLWGTKQRSRRKKNLDYERARDYIEVSHLR